MQSDYKKQRITKNFLKNISLYPGIYIFWDISEKPIYVGKSSQLRARVKSYFLTNLSSKTAQMMSQAKFLSTIRVTSDLEALLLEAKLVNNLQPKFNSQLKDDKHPLYIQITKDTYPQVLTARKINKRDKNLAFFGPFPSSQNVKRVLKILRRIFPFAQHKPGKRGCLYSQIGLCNPCPSVIENTSDPEQRRVMIKEYRKNINHIKNVLTGKLTSVRKHLVKKMDKLAKIEKYESALSVREQIRMLDYVTQPVTPIGEFLKNPNLVDDIRKDETTALRSFINEHLAISKNFNRIECFDVAHLAGTHPTASMVTFINSEPDKTFYRHFRIRQKKGGNDIASLKEVAERRAGHFSDWGIPNLIVVDGGKAQVKVFTQVMSEYKVPVIGLAKRFETLVIPNSNLSHFIEKRVPRGPILNLLQRLRNEAHRFARRYHHKLIQKSLLNA